MPSTSDSGPRRCKHVHQVTQHKSWTCAIEVKMAKEENLAWENSQIREGVQTSMGQGKGLVRGRAPAGSGKMRKWVGWQLSPYGQPWKHGGLAGFLGHWLLEPSLPLHPQGCIIFLHPPKSYPYLCSFPCACPLKFLSHNTTKEPIFNSNSFLVTQMVF